MDQSTLTALFGTVIFVILVMLFLPSKSAVSDKRVKSVSRNGASEAKGSRMLSFLKVEDTSQRRRQIEESLSQLEENQKDRKKKLKSLSSKLVQADWTTKPQTFTIISVIVGLAIGAGVFFVSKNPMISAGVAFVCGFGVPRAYLNFIIGRRQKKFTSGFADAMDIIVRGVRTGLPLGDCLKIIAHESPHPVGSEFLRVVEAESVGVPIDVCLERMYERMPVQEVNFFSTVLNIQRSTGGNLGESLANLSNVLRGRKMLREKIKALSAEAKMSAIIIGALPLIVMALVTITSPDYMTELYTTPTGHRNLMIGAAMMVMGIAVMRKMINFKI